MTAASVEVEPRVLEGIVLRPCDVPSDYNVMAQLALTLSRAKILPEHFHDKPDDVMAVMWQAKALDIALMIAIQHCYVTDNGKVEEDAKLQHGLARRAGHRLKKVESTNQRAVIDVFLYGEVVPVRVTYTIAEAAHLLWKNNWQTSTTAMLWARCVTRAVTQCCPEVTLGLYWNDGLGPEAGDARPESAELAPGELGPEIETVLRAADEIASLEDPAKARASIGTLFKNQTALLDCVAHEDGTTLRTVLQDLTVAIVLRQAKAAEDTGDAAAAVAQMQKLWTGNTALLDCAARDDGTTLRTVLQDIAAAIVDRRDSQPPAEPAAEPPAEPPAQPPAPGPAAAAPADEPADEPGGDDTGPAQPTGQPAPDGESAADGEEPGPAGTFPCGCVMVEVITTGAHRDGCEGRPA